MKRRLLCLVLAALAVSGCATAPVATADAEPMTAAAQAAMTPDQALARLKAGNERFASGRMLVRDLPAQVKATSHGQYPFATVLSCIDSRAGPELVFDQGIGDVFSPRIAGNFANEDILGSMEFASRLAGAKLVVVLGHSSCGAIKGACDDAALGNLTALIGKLKPVVASVPSAGDRSSKNAAFVELVARANVQRTVQDILERSPVLREMQAAGRIKVVGAMLDVETGKVTWY